jgi:hypothetical protein
MRRWVGLAIGLCAALTTTGVAVANAKPIIHRATAPLTVAPAEPVAGTGTSAGGLVGTPDATDDVVGTVDRAAETLDYRTARRTTTFHHSGASYMKVHFNRLRLMPGDDVTVSDATGSQTHRYLGDPIAAVGPSARGGDRGRWAMSIDGDTVVVTMHTAATGPGVPRDGLAGIGAEIDRVARGFTAAERDARAESTLAGGGREESVCGSDDKRDAACYKATDPVAYTRSKAVARLLINGVELCSAWRVGPDNRMFTNHHCLADTQSARNSEVWFDYECAVCGGPTLLKPTKVLGDQVIATDERLDYTLFSVRSFRSITRFGYLLLDTRAPRAGQELYVPQHPSGDPTKIAIDSRTELDGNCAVVDPSYHGYADGTDLSYYCDTAGGSSGSPVLARDTDAVIGLHHFGGCPNSGVRMDLIYSQVGALL